MESAAGNGTVTALASEYPPEETQKAATRVHDSIAAAQLEMERTRGFISDNSNLINLVQRLPENLHHNIMVPFGKAAFFPGRLVHTNEFLVLLGDGYYADTTSKQTLDILKRRGKSLESQLSSLNAVVQDLQAEASFFRSTASEMAKLGIVEIREDYVEKSSVESDSESGPLSDSEADNKKTALDDQEFARIMARFDELEKEEREAEAENESEDEDERIDTDFKGLSDEVTLDEIVSTQKPEYKAKDKVAVAGEIRNSQHYHLQDFTDELNCTGLTAQAMPKDKPASLGNTSSSNMKMSTEKSVVPTVENKVQVSTSSRFQAPVPTPDPSFDSRKAFTGSIVERADNLPKHTPTQTSGSQHSKPVSRFKMLRK